MIRGRSRNAQKRGDPLSDVRVYRNRLVHGRIVPQFGVQVFEVGTGASASGRCTRGLTGCRITWTGGGPTTRGASMRSCPNSRTPTRSFAHLGGQVAVQLEAAAGRVVDDPPEGELAEAGSYFCSHGETEKASPGVPPRQATVVPASCATAERIDAGSGM
jgi:hypothetical protein